MVTQMVDNRSRGTAPQDDGEFLCVSGISKEFKDHEVLNDIDLAIGEQEFVTFLGPSGCGKTTLLRIIAGLESPTAGEVRFKRENLTRHMPDARPFNTVFQSYALFPNMSVEDNIGFGPRLAGESPKAIQQRVGEMLELVRLHGMEKSAIAQLSGGQQQRVALARALINSPEVLLLDEPLSALDLQIRKHLQEELRSIQREIGGTFVYVTHDQEEALILSDRIAVLEGGRIAQMGEPREIYMKPADRFVAEFVGEANLLDCRIIDICDGGVTAAFAEGSSAYFDVADAGQLRQGSEALVVLRPHELEICDDLPHATLTGTVVEQAFLGSHLRYMVSVPGVGIARVNGGLSGDRTGSEVGLRIQAGCGHVIAE
jgi:spermidine/putrescine transport system ATP-binding protein